MKQRNQNHFSSLAQSSKRLALPTLAFTLLAASHVSAQTWDGGGGDANWGTAANWVGDMAPASGPGTNLTFAGTAGLTSNNAAGGGFAMGTLTFDSSAGAFTLTGFQLRSNGTITNNSSNLQTISNPVVINQARTVDTGVAGITFTDVFSSISTTQGITKIGTGTLTFANTNTFGGATTLNSGTLKLNYGIGGTNGTKLADAAALNLNGGTLELSGGSHVETVSSTTLNFGGTFIKQTNSGTSTLSMGLITFTGGGIDFSADSIATTTSTVTNGILSQRATVAGANFAMKSGSDIVAYDYPPANGATGYTGGPMSANTNYALQTAGGVDTLVTNNTGFATNTLKIANTAPGTFALNNLRLDVGAILFAGSADYAFTFTPASAGRVASLGIVHNYGTAGATLTLGAPLNTLLVHFGTGKTILGANALQPNSLTINGGTVQFSNNLQIGNNADVRTITLNNGTLLANTAGGNIALDNAGTLSRLVALGNGGGTLDVIGGNKLTVSGVISGPGNSLTVGGANTSGTVEFSGANTYSGATAVNGGTLGLGASGVLPDASTLSIGTATLDISTFTETAGALDITASGATINLGSGGSIAFADSSGIDWTGGTLNITGTFVPGTSVRFGSTAGALKPAQLGLISVNGNPGPYLLDAAGFLIPDAADPYLTWAGPGVPFDGDANNDSVANGLAWLLGASGPSVNALGLLPASVASGGSMQLSSFNMRNMAGRAGAIVQLQHSSDLGISDPWASVTVPETSGTLGGVTFTITPGSPFNSVQATVSSSEAAGGKLFSRLKGQK